MLPEKSTPESAPNPGFSDNVGRLVTASRNRSIFIQMISTHAFAEDDLARAGVPALSIDPSGSRKAHYFRDDTVLEATDMVSRDSSCRRDSIAAWVDGGPVRISIRANSEINTLQEDV